MHILKKTKYIWNIFCFVPNLNYATSFYQMSYYASGTKISTHIPKRLCYFYVLTAYYLFFKEHAKDLITQSWFPKRVYNKPIDAFYIMSVKFRMNNISPD